MRFLLKTGLTSFSYKFLLAITFILQLIVTKFSRELVGEKSFLLTIWLKWKICYHSNKSLYLYLTHFESDSNETWQVGSKNENLSKNVVAWKIGYHDNNNETRLLYQL